MSKNEQTTTTTITAATIAGLGIPELVALIPQHAADPAILAVLQAALTAKASQPVAALQITMLPGGYIEIRDKAGFRGDVCRLTVDRALALSAPGVAERIRKAAEATAKAWSAERCTRYWDAYKAAAATPEIKALLDSSDKAKQSEGRKLRDEKAMAAADSTTTTTAAPKASTTPALATF